MMDPGRQPASERLHTCMCGRKQSWLFSRGNVGMGGSWETRRLMAKVAQEEGGGGKGGRMKRSEAKRLNIAGRFSPDQTGWNFGPRSTTFDCSALLSCSSCSSKRAAGASSTGFSLTADLWRHFHDSHGAGQAENARGGTSGLALTRSPTVPQKSLLFLQLVVKTPLDPQRHTSLWWHKGSY